MSKSKHRPRRRFTNPMWWNHLWTEVPNRAKAKKLEKEVVKDPEIAESAIWPHPKKPHAYYW